MQKFTLPIEIFHMDDNGCHLFVKANINRKKNCWLIIDTGASKTVFAKDLFKDSIEIVESENKIKSSGINSENIESNFCIIKKLSLNEFIIKDYSSILMDLSHINQLYKALLNRKIWGLIGGDFLLKYYAKIDYKSRKIILFK